LVEISASGAEPQLETQRQRLRFEELVHESAPDVRCRITVRLEWRGERIQGQSDGLETLQGRLRAAAEATLRATIAATSSRPHFEVVGVKAIRAFDGWVVVVRVNGAAEGRTYKLLGSASCEEEERLPQTAALAVLDATNRVVERFMQQQP
jgi:hypothetical protein